MPVDPCFVEFDVKDQSRFKALCQAFQAIKADKDADNFREDEAWEELFDKQALAHFWWPTEQELKDWEGRWFSTPVEHRHKDPSLQTPWTFLSMIEMFKECDYQLIACRMVAPNVGRLEFEPFGWPYGGTGCLNALLAAFEFRVTGENDGTGYHASG